MASWARRSAFCRSGRQPQHRSRCLPHNRWSTGCARRIPSAHGRLAAAAYPGLPIGRHDVALILGAALLALTPGLWRGTRTAVSLTVIGLVALAALNAGHGRYGDAAVEAGLALLLALGRGAFRLGCSNRPGPVVACAALVAWGLAAGAVLSAPGRPAHGGPRHRRGPAPPGRPRADGGLGAPDQRGLGRADRRAHRRRGDDLGAGAALARPSRPRPATTTPSTSTGPPGRSSTPTAPIRCRRSCCGPTRRWRSPPAACSPTG